MSRKANQLRKRIRIEREQAAANTLRNAYRLQAAQCEASKWKERYDEATTLFRLTPAQLHRLAPLDLASRPMVRDDRTWLLLSVNGATECTIDNRELRLLHGTPEQAVELIAEATLGALWEELQKQLSRQVRTAVSSFVAKELRKA